VRIVRKQQVSELQQVLYRATAGLVQSYSRSCTELQQVLYRATAGLVQSYSRSCTELQQVRKSRTELQQVLYGMVRTVRIELQQLLPTAKAATPKDIKKAKAGNGKK